MFLAAASEYDQVRQRYYQQPCHLVVQGFGGGPHREQDGGELKLVPDHPLLPLVQVCKTNIN